MNGVLKKFLPEKDSWFSDLLITGAFLCLATVANFMLLNMSQSTKNVSEIYILAIMLTALETSGYFWGLVAALAGVIGVNYFFTYPYFALNFTITGYPLTFVCLLAVAVIISSLVTNLKEQEKAKLASEKEKLRLNLIRAISHDFRTPLTSIMGASSAILENSGRIDEESKNGLIKDINEDAEWLLHMVENVLSVTKISDKGAVLYKTPEPVEEVLAQAVKQTKKRFPNVKINIAMPEELLMVPMDAMLVEQVLINLLENAVKHGNTQMMDISVRIEGENAEFCVRDYGRGLLPEDLPNLFTGMGFSEKRSADSTRGLGIGLSMCRSIVEAHGGTIKGVNNADGGASFTFTLPLEEV